MRRKKGKNSSPKERKDTAEKEFVSFPDVAADVMNVLLYGGKRMMEAGNLLPGPTETLYQGRTGLRSQYEDLCKSGDSSIICGCMCSR